MNRTGSYIAFDGLGESDPSKSDFRYYSTLQAWAANKNIDFNFVNSHEKTYVTTARLSQISLKKSRPAVLRKVSGAKAQNLIGA